MSNGILVFIEHRDGCGQQDFVGGNCRGPKPWDRNCSSKLVRSSWDPSLMPWLSRLQPMIW